MEWYNTYTHASTKVIPFEALYRYKPPRLLSYDLGFSQLEEVDLALKDRECIIRLLKFNLNRAQERIKLNVDSKRKEQNFQVGESVYLQL